MKRLLIAAAALLMGVAAQAQDTWTGPDKVGHAKMGGGIGVVTTLLTKDAKYGCLAATVAGAAKEAYDYKHRDKHDPSVKDFVVTAVAGCAAAYGTQWLFVVPKQGGADIVWSKRF